MASDEEADGHSRWVRGDTVRPRLRVIHAGVIDPEVEPLVLAEAESSLRVEGNRDGLQGSHIDVIRRVGDTTDALNVLVRRRGDGGNVVVIRRHVDATRSFRDAPAEQGAYTVDVIPVLMNLRPDSDERAGSLRGCSYGHSFAVGQFALPHLQISPVRVLDRIQRVADRRVVSLA